MNNINLYIKESVGNIAKKGMYITPDIPEKKLNNAINAFNCQNFQKSILAIYDTTFLGSAKEGLVFTGEKLLYNNGSLFEIYYKDIKKSEYLKDTIVKNNSKEEIEHYIQIKTENKIYRIDNLGTFNYQAFERLLNDIINDFDSYIEEDQLKTISEMSEEFKKAYLKIIVNMTFIDDEEIDENELAEILLLMTRLELSKESRFDVRSYIAEVSHENLIGVTELIKTIKENSESTHFQSLMISLAKDIINVYFSTNDSKDRDIKFLIENQSLFTLSDKEIDLAFSAVENDYKMLKEDLDDSAIKKNAEDLASKAAAAGAPLAAVYISGSVVGMSAAGITSGLATLGMGMGMTGGLVIVGLIGIVTYKGLKHLTGASELDKYKTRELILHEVIKQTQKTISLIIDDINFIVQKLNDVTLNSAEQNEKINKLTKMFASAIKIVDNKTNNYQNSVNRVSCPKELDVSRLKSLTAEPIKSPLFDFIIKNYEEKSTQSAEKQNSFLGLKENIDTEVLDKMGSVFKSLGYFEMGNIMKGNVSEGIGKFKGMIG